MTYFKISDFDFKGGNGYLYVHADGLMDEDFLNCLDMAREHAGIPFVITSGYRPAEFDFKMHGIKNSDHSQGCACDILAIDGISKFKIVNALLLSGFNRIGVGKVHIHCSINAVGLPVNVLFQDC